MQKEELKELFEKDPQSTPQNNINSEMLSEIDNLIFEKFDENNVSEEVLSVYKKFVPMKQEAPDSMKDVLFITIRNFANDELSKGNYLNSLILFRFLTVKSILQAEDFPSIAKCLVSIGEVSDFLTESLCYLYEEKSDNKLLCYIDLADFYKSIKNNQRAIESYEKFLEIDKTKVAVYTITADLYSKEYGDERLDRQIELYKAAYQLAPDNRLVLHGLAFCYEGIGDNENAEIYYKKLLENNPTENDYYNYGGFLIHCGDFINGHRYFAHRTNVDDINLKYPIEDESRRWDLKSDISDKTLVIHYEQGFGDTIMYSRFVPIFDGIAKKVIFVVQEELSDLIKNSEIFKDITVVTSIEDVEYDYSMALLDTPLALGVDIEAMPFTTEYLNVSQEKILEYKNKHLPDSAKIRVGISCSGDMNANYASRDLDISRLSVLKDIENTQFFNLQKNDANAEFVTNLGDTFSNFTDTAAALKNMDVIISTDNVILNLAGALGIKTLAMFNKKTNYRWYCTVGENVGWYESVKPLQCEEQNNWNNVILELFNELKKTA